MSEVEDMAAAVRASSATAWESMPLVRQADELLEQHMTDVSWLTEGSSNPHLSDYLVGLQEARERLATAAGLIGLAQARIAEYLAAIGMGGGRASPAPSIPQAPAPREPTATDTAYKYYPLLIKDYRNPASFRKQKLLSMAYNLGPIALPPTAAEIALIKESAGAYHIIRSTPDLLHRQFSPNIADILTRIADGFRQLIQEKRTLYGYGDLTGELGIEVGGHTDAAAVWHVDGNVDNPARLARFVLRYGEVGSTEFAEGSYDSQNVNHRGFLRDTSLVNPSGPLVPTRHGHGRVSLFYTELTIHRADPNPGSFVNPHFGIFLTTSAETHRENV